MLVAAPASAFPRPPPRTLQAATDVLNDLVAIPGNRIPAALLAQAQGVAIIPRVIKAGFLIGGRGGHGLVATRDRNGAWSGVTFVDLGGASFGLQAGVESADVVLVFKSRNSLNRILGGRGKLTLGADAAVAAGPMGVTRKPRRTSFSGPRSCRIREPGPVRGRGAGRAAIVYNRRTNADYLNDHRPETCR